MLSIKSISRRGTYLRITAFIAVAALVSGVIFFANGCSRPAVAPPKVMAAGITLEASRQDALGIPTDTDFILTSREALSPSVIKSSLIVEPEVELAVEEVGGDSKQFRIIPRTELASNKVYRFSFSDGSWAFQTRSDFRIVGSLPRDGGGGVPVNSGIEITFSHENYEDPDVYFEITPRAEGYFERHKRTAVFVPKGLKPGTIYTVKIKKGLGVSDSEEVLEEDYVFRFETQAPGVSEGKGPSMEIYINRNLYDYPSGERPVIDFSYYSRSRQETDVNFTVNLYKYRDADHFIEDLERYYSIPSWAEYSRRMHRVDTSGLVKTATFKTPLRNIGHKHYILFPEEPEQGFYLTEITCRDQVTGEDIVNRLWLQVTDTSGYVSVSTDKTLVWANSVRDGAPVSGAIVELKDGGVLGKTGSDGLLEFETPRDLVDTEENEETYQFLKIVSPEYGPCVIPLYKSGYSYYSGVPRYNHWTYVYLDRELYLPEDTVNFWGIIKPREGARGSSKVTVELEKSGYYDYYYRPSVIAKKEIQMSEDYTFTANMKLPNLSPGRYSMVFRIDGKEVMEKWFEVQTYTKPAYRIDIDQDKKAVFSGKDRISFDVKASFFEGTPLSSMKLSYYSSSGSGELVTGEKGEAQVDFVPKYNNTRGVSSNEYFSVYNTLPEAGEIRSSVSYMVFHNDMNLSSYSRFTDEGAEIRVKLNRITLDRINNPDSEEEALDRGTPEYIGDPVTGHEIRGTISENRWEKEEAGQYYDFINKEVRTRYNYRHYTVPVEDFAITTDASGEGTYVFPYEEEKSYTVRLEATDGMGRTVVREEHIYGSRVLYYDRAYWDYYHLEEVEENRRCYGVGQEYFLVFKNNSEILPEGGPNRFLFLVGRNGLKDYRVKDVPSFSARFEETDIPNLYVTGVYFNGRTYYRANPYFVRYDSSERKLDIKVTPDKTSYRPGEEVALGVEVKDGTGKPREAEVNISLVDEAMFMLMEQRADILAGIYSNSLPSGVLTDCYSHWCPDISDKPAAECGEGEGERKDFRDTAFFGTVKTNDSGKGKITFKVPDNLTSWRATYQGVTNDLRAGDGNVPVKVSLPFFVDMVLNETYLAGDKPFIAVRSFGTGTASGDTVKFTVTAPSLFQGEKRYEAKSSETVYIELPQLKEGKHAITVEGSTGGGLKDILTREITVYKTYLQKEKTDYYNVKKGLKIKGADNGLTKVVFTDNGRGRYLQPLYRLYHTYGKRIDQRLARLYSYNLLKEYFDGVDMHEPDDINAHSYQAPDGGIAILPYSDSEPELSAKIASLGHRMFDANSLRDYFYQIVMSSEGTTEEVSSALWGLAALDEPVLVQINSMYGLEDISLKARLYLGLALWELGDSSKARKVFQDIVRNHGEVKKPYTIINSGGDRDDALELTALAAALGARVGAPESGAMFNYVRDNSTKDILVYLEELIYLSSALSGTDVRPVSFAYMLGDERVEKELESGRSYQILLHPGNIHDFRVVDVKGDVGLACIYDDEFKVEDTEESEDIVITRRYIVNGNSVSMFGENDLIKVEIDCKFGDKALDGRYQITDFLPSGLKILAAPYSRGLGYSGVTYPYEINGQKVSFYLYNYEKRYRHLKRPPVVYYARVVSKGEYRAQGALIQNLKAGGEIKMTEEERIIIK